MDCFRWIKINPDKKRKKCFHYQLISSVATPPLTHVYTNPVTWYHYFSIRFFIFFAFCVKIQFSWCWWWCIFIHTLPPLPLLPLPVSLLVSLDAVTSPSCVHHPSISTFLHIFLHVHHYRAKCRPSPFSFGLTLLSTGLFRHIYCWNVALASGPHSLSTRSMEAQGIKDRFFLKSVSCCY